MKIWTLLLVFAVSCSTPINQVVTSTVSGPSSDIEAHRFTATVNSNRDVNGPDLDCPDFSSQPEAQAFFIRGGGITDDRHNLDGDDDGIACEQNEPWSIIGTGGPAKAPETPSVGPPSNGQCWVNGYYRKNGTYVKGYWRRC